MTSESTTDMTTITCSACQLPLEGNFARALDGAFHWNCFLCIVSLLFFAFYIYLTRFLL